MTAVKKKHREVLQLLLRSGADVNVPDGEGWAPLHWAADKNQREEAIALVEAGAELNALSSLGETPLFRAAANSHIVRCQSSHFLRRLLTLTRTASRRI